MELTVAEGRVLGCLIDRQAADPSRHALTLDDVRFACNQGHPRELAAFDDRVVDDALLSLKSKGLVRFVVEGHGVGPVRYRHRAAERWRLDPPELAVLSTLLLGGPQTLADVEDAVDAAGSFETEADAEVREALDALAGRTPTPFATRVTSPTWGGETFWTEVLTGPPSPDELHQAYLRREARPRSPRPPRPVASPPTAAPGATPPATPTSIRAGGDPGGAPSRAPATSSAPRPEPLPLVPNKSAAPPTVADLAERLSKIERRLARIEAALDALRVDQESSRMIR